MPCYQRGWAVISSCVWGVIDQQSVMVCRSDGCHFERGAIILLLLSEMMPCPRENRGSLDALSRGCHVTARLVKRCCLLFAGSPHLPIRHNKTSEPSSAGWLNNSSPLLPFFLLHTGDGATVTCVNSNPSHNTVCTPQAGTQGYTVSKKKNLLFLSE